MMQALDAEIFGDEGNDDEMDVEFDNPDFSEKRNANRRQIQFDDDDDDQARQDDDDENDEASGSRGFHAADDADVLGDLEQITGDGDGTEAGEDSEQPGKIKRRMGPQPKLNEARICGEKGLPMLAKIFENYKSNPRKDEYGNLTEVMNKMEHWAHCLFPKLTFDDFLARSEQLGHKRPVQNCMTKIRLGLQEDEDDFIDRDGDRSPRAVSPILDQSPSPSARSPLRSRDNISRERLQPDSPDRSRDNAGSRDSSRSRASGGDSPLFESSDRSPVRRRRRIVSSPEPSPSPPPKAPTATISLSPESSEITDEMKQRIEENRRKAMQIRQKRIEEAAKLKEQEMSDISSSLQASPLKNDSPPPEHAKEDENSNLESVGLTESDIMSMFDD